MNGCPEAVEWRRLEDSQPSLPITGHNNSTPRLWLEALNLWKIAQWDKRSLRVGERLPNSFGLTKRASCLSKTFNIEQWASAFLILFYKTVLPLYV
jgi:hypothetical protein